VEIGFLDGEALLIEEMSLSERAKNLGLSGIRRMGEIAGELERRGVRVVKLHLGDPDFPTPRHICEGIEEALREGKTHYTSFTGIPELREAIAERENDLYGSNIHGDNIVVTMGAIHAVSNSIYATCDPGKKILIQDPGWAAYEGIANFHGVYAEYYSTEGDIVETIRKKVERDEDIQAVIVNSPSNPDGLIFDRKTLQEIIDIVLSRPRLSLITDECYERIIFQPFTSLLQISRDLEQAIKISSFSKTYAMTGHRVGYLIARPEVMERMAVIAYSTVACPNSYSQYGALAALKGAQDCTEEMVREYKRRVDLGVNMLNEVEGIECRKPMGTFYLFPRFEGVKDSRRFAEELLMETHVCVSPGITFGPSGKDKVRISCTAPIEEIEEAIRRITDYFRRMRH
jgi:aspartate aminotransferase